ncbi:MAG: hypothetical protein IJ086_00300 [Clostridium sp.]|nr:hypothetical protein [Clostridium sp.]
MKQSDIRNRFLRKDSINENYILKLKKEYKDIYKVIEVSLDKIAFGIEQIHINEEDKNNISEIVKENANKALIYSFIIDCRRKAKLNNVECLEYINEKEKDLIKTIKYINIKYTIGIILILLALIVSKTNIFPEQYDIAISMMSYLFISIIIIYIFYPNKVLKEKLKHKKDIINEAKKLI